MGLRAQARLNTIGAGLTRVARGHLETRIALEGPRDDLSHLSDRINLTTAQLEAAVQNLRVQSANIAHDLRTPLARLRAVLESRLSALETRGTPVTAEDLEAALGHIDQIVGTFDALLRIARVESGAARSEFQTIDLERVSHDFLEIYAPVVEEQGQRLELVTTAPAHIRGDRALILQALANLVQNALRYGAQDQTITLKVSGRTLTVTDQGPGIRQEKIEQVLQPLFQLETTRQSEGFGLGLSLVKAVCDLHDADLTLGPGPDARGLCVQIRFAGADSG
jgi:signal transduction histidine kinase